MKQALTLVGPTWNNLVLHLDNQLYITIELRFLVSSLNFQTLKPFQICSCDLYLNPSFRFLGEPVEVSKNLK